MASLWVTIPLALLAAGLLTFIFIRLSLHKLQASGRAAYIGGGTLVLVAVTWNIVQSIPSYPTWFIITAYPVLSNVMYVVVAVGLALVAVALALYADSQRSRRQDIELRENRLGLLQTLQQETRASYQLLELLSLTLREILVQTPERSGAIFLINRGKRQLVLGASANLTKNETAYLEHFTLDSNAVAQAIDLGDPMISGALDMSDVKGMPVQSRFQSSLVLPLISGTEKIGAIVLMAEEARSFSRVDVHYLAPVADWVAEKIRTARLTRDLSVIRTELETITVRQTSLVDRLSASAQTLAGAGNLGEFCRQLIGLSGSSEVYLCGLSQGTLQVYGGTDNLGDLTEQYKHALVDALERRKPLIINHESSDRDGQSTVVRSSLVFPVVNDATDVLLLRKDGGPFQISDQDIRMLGFFGLLARFALQQRESSRRDLARRVGFDKVIQLIRPDTIGSETGKDVGFFVRHLSDMFPGSSQAITLVRHSNGSFSAATALHIDETELVDLLLEPGEGIVGESVIASAPRFVYGKRNVLAAIEAFGPSAQQIFHRSFGERRLPQMLAACPLVDSSGISEVALFFLYEIPETERVEWERMLSLAVSLYGLRRNMASIAGAAQPIELSTGDSDRIAPLINQLNNHLSAVIGNADLAAGREEVSGELRNQLKAIASEAENAAALLKRSLVVNSTAIVSTEHKGETINQAVSAVLHDARISGNLYMAGGRPREVDLRLSDISSISFNNNEIRQLFEAVLNRFAAIASEEDVISIATYVQDNFVYLDISRHRKNFPPVEPVAGFGEYQPADQALQHRPSEVFLKPVTQGICYFAADQTGPTPAYLSFKFPLKASHTAPQAASHARQFAVLAIDDQAVILDLISAMCQSLGYQVQTASSGTEGVRLAASSRFDIVLTDLAMPDLTGLEVARQIRKLQPEIPIILVTGWEAGLDQTEVETAGITEVLLKPFRIEQLTDIIRAVAAKRS